MVRLTIPQDIRQQYKLMRLLTPKIERRDKQGRVLFKYEEEDNLLVLEPDLTQADLPNFLFLAYHRELKMDVVVRFILAWEDEAEEQVADQLRSMVYTMWNFRHDHLIPVVDYGVLGSDALGLRGARPLRAYFFVCEALRSSQRITDALGAADDLEPHIELLGQALAALEYAHQRQVIHGQLHPGNLLVEAWEGALALRLTDFGHGVDRRLRHEADKTSPYKPPYQRLDPSFQMLSAASDLWSLATIFYEVLSGQPLAHAPDPFQRPDADVPAAPPPLPQDAPAATTPAGDILLTQYASRSPAQPPQLHDPTPVRWLADLRQRYGHRYPYLLWAMEAAWSMKASAAQVREILTNPHRLSHVPFVLHLIKSSEEDLHHLVRAVCPLMGEESALVELSDLAPAAAEAQQLLAARNGEAIDLEFPRRLFERLLPRTLAMHLIGSRERARHLYQEHDHASHPYSGYGPWSLPIYLDFSLADKALIDWPWELLSEGQDWLALEPTTPLVRMIDAPYPDGERHLSRRLSLLIVAAQPDDTTTRVNVAGEVSKLEEALAVQETFNYTINKVESGRWQDVREALRECKPNVVHFIGHGDADGNLLFCNEHNLTDRVGARDVGLLFQDQERGIGQDRGIELMFLNACNSAVGGSPNVQNIVAVALVKQGIPNVLAMQHAIEDVDAVLLSSTFYRQLARGHSFIDALTEARRVLYDRNRSKLLWATPVLYIS